MKQLKQIDKSSAKIAKLKKEIELAIASLPDNPNIHRLSNNCFTVSSSQIFSSTDNPHSRLDPFYQDFKAQYKKIAEVISKSRSENVSKVLDEIVRTGKIQRDHRCHSLHPTVINHLKNLLETA